MAFEIHEHTHVYKVWYVELLPRKGNMMIMIYRNPPEPWQATYRFRWYKDARVFNSNDERSWYHIKPPAGEPGVQAKLTDTFEQMLAVVPWPTEIIRVHVDATGEAAMAILMKQPWMHKGLPD